MNKTTIRIGDWVFDSVDYDADADVLYLAMGEPRSGHGEETAEGHVARFDEDGAFYGVTLFDVRATLETGGEVRVTLPRRLPKRETLHDETLRELVC
jgi:uncharacterized protein YuzE